MLQRIAQRTVTACKVVYTALLSLKFTLIIGLCIMSETLPDRATAKSLMTTHLPQYLCNCLLLCGFDTLEVISEIKVNSTLSAGDSVHEIEKYVNENVPGDMQYTHMAAPSCKVPPGHRIALQKFIGLVKVKLGMGNETQRGK